MNTHHLGRMMAAAAAAMLVAQAPGLAHAETEPSNGPQAAEGTQAVSDWAKVKLSGGARRPSLGLDPSSGQPYISFHQAALDQFWLARHTENPAKSCGSNAGWECKSLNNTPTAGTDTRLAFIPGKNEFGVAWTVPAQTAYHISRFDLNLNWLGTDHTGALANPQPDWYSRPMDLMYIGDRFIEAIEQAYGSGDVNKYLRIRRHDQAYATYPAPDIAEGRQGHNSHGRYASIDWSVGNDGGLPDDKIERIAFRDSTGGLRHSYAKFDQNGSGCVNPWNEVIEEWSCEQVDPAADVYWTDIRATKCSGAECADPMRIYYLDKTSGKLKLAERTGNAAHNCNGGVAGWSCGAIDSIAAGKSVEGIRISMAAIGGGANQVKVAYTDKDDGATSVLKIATRTGNAGDACTPGGLAGWKCEVVDNGGGTDNTGWDPSLGWDGTNLYVAYYNHTLDVLMVAFPKRDAPIGFSKTYTPGALVRGATFNVVYTIQNNSDRALSHMRIADGLLTWHEYVGVASDTCGLLESYTPGVYADVFEAENGELAPNSSCTLVIKMRTSAVAPQGKGADGPGNLDALESFPVAPTGQSQFSILTPVAYVPATVREAEADW